MATTYSALKIQLMGTGENSTTWGDVTNLNWAAIESAASGSATVTFSSADVTLTMTDTNAAQTARNLRLVLSGTYGAGSRNLIVPTTSKMYMVVNNLSGAVTVKTSGGTGVAVPAGKTTIVYCNGTDVLTGLDFSPNLTATNLTVTNFTTTNLTATTLAVSGVTTLNVANVTNLNVSDTTITSNLVVTTTITSVYLNALFNTKLDKTGIWNSANKIVTLNNVKMAMGTRSVGNITPGSSSVITFGIAFTETPHVMVSAVRASGVVQSFTVYLTTVNTTACTVVFDEWSTVTQDASVNWLAIGTA